MAPSDGPAIVLPATHEMDDFQNISIGQAYVFQCRTRHDFEIALNSDLGRIQPNIADEVGNGCPGPKLPRIAIQREGDRIGDKGRGHFISLFLSTRI
jgi:hypothetical protein